MDTDAATAGILVRLGLHTHVRSSSSRTTNKRQLTSINVQQITRLYEAKSHSSHWRHNRVAAPPAPGRRYQRFCHEVIEDAEHAIWKRTSAS